MRGMAHSRNYLIPDVGRMPLMIQRCTTRKRIIIGRQVWNAAARRICPLRWCCSPRADRPIRGWSSRIGGRGPACEARASCKLYSRSGTTAGLKGEYVAARSRHSVQAPAADLRHSWKATASAMRAIAALAAITAASPECPATNPRAGLPKPIAI
jgi:hypothetical protein